MSYKLSKKLDKQIENLLVAAAMMQEIGPAQLIPNLASWASDEMVKHGPNHCGSAACFGGWCAVHPHFQKQSVRPLKRSDGAPAMRSRDGGYDRQLEGCEVSEKLFGNDTLFDWMGDSYHGTNHRPKQEHKTILKRIERQLDRLFEQQAQEEEDAKYNRRQRNRANANYWSY